MIHRVSDGEILRGRRVLIVAATPSDTELESRGSVVLEAEEALAGTIRAIVAEGGRIDLIADESLALLAAVVAGEYFEPHAAESFDRGGASKEPENVSEPPPIRVYTTSRGDDALTIFSRGDQIEEDSSRDPFEVVAHVAGDSAALICIGDAPFDKYIDLFRGQNKLAPIFTFAYSGRAARNLFELNDISAFDLELSRQEPVRSRKRDLDGRRDQRLEQGEEGELPVDFEFQFPPVALAAQLIVQQIADHGEKRLR